MYKLVVFTTLVAIAMAAPRPNTLVYSSPVLTPVSSHVVTSVVSPAVTSYSSYSNGVVHGTPVVVQQARVVPVLQQTSYVQAYSYPEHVIVA